MISLGREAWSGRSLTRSRWIPAEEYHRHLASREWALLKRAVRERSGGRCERCWYGKYEQTHHATYIRVLHEHLDDLLGLCAVCHEYLSAVHDNDPAALLHFMAHWVPFLFQATAVDEDEHRVTLRVLGALPPIWWTAWIARELKAGIDPGWMKGHPLAWFYDPRTLQRIADAAEPLKHFEGPWVDRCEAIMVEEAGF